ncbi:MAG: hypothetical protein MJE68_03285 [Proteobacteria bacterium]|nr:hypothetical protein [Pseudomonadota bacterium]
MKENFSKKGTRFIKCTTALEQKRLQQLLNVEDLRAKSSAKCNQQLLGDKATSIHSLYIQHKHPGGSSTTR